MASTRCSAPGLPGPVRGAGAVPAARPQIKSLLSEMINGAPNTPEHKGVRCTLYLFQVSSSSFFFCNAKSICIS